MSYGEPARTAADRTRLIILAALAGGSAALVGVLIYQSLPSQSPSASSTSSPSTSSTAAPSIGPPQGDHHRPPGAARPGPPRKEGPQAGGTRSGAAVADGAVPEGLTVFDDDVPAVANLDPDLLAALRRAAADAADDGVAFVVNSGWRSPEYQERLLREAVSEYGSEEEAARWVATADTSLHVSGDAVDIGPSAATAWLSENGAEYGLCQVYDNEPWHYELRPGAIDDGCPPRYADPTHDPRMQR